MHGFYSMFKGLHGNGGPLMFSPAPACRLSALHVVAINPIQYVQATHAGAGQNINGAPLPCNPQKNKKTAEWLPSLYCIAGMCYLARSAIWGCLAGSAIWGCLAGSAIWGYLAGSAIWVCLAVCSAASPRILCMCCPSLCDTVLETAASS
jgi:hypothetical protein